MKESFSAQLIGRVRVRCSAFLAVAWLKRARVAVSSDCVCFHHTLELAESIWNM